VSNSEFFMTPAVLALLAVTALPPTAKPGGVEKLIDLLIDLKGFRDTHFDLEEPVDDLIRLGFDAVPVLLEHLDDERPTSGFAPVMNNFRGYRYQVKHYVRDVLNIYIDAGEGWFQRLRGDELKKEDAAKWWAEAKKLGEEKFLVQNITGDDHNGKVIRRHLLYVLEVKHPERLPDGFASALKAAEGELHYSPLVEAVVNSKLPVASKKQLFLDLYALKSWEGKAAALDGLHTVDPDEFHNLLIASLGALPKHPKGPDGEEWPFRGFRSFADTASLTADAKVWAAVQKYLGRASVEVRIEWIDCIAWQIEGKEGADPQKIRLVECLVELLNDATPHKREYNVGVETGEIRDHAAKRLAEALRLKITPAEKWNADQWAKFRDEVAKAAKPATK
jgi:hypothetical protein